MEVKMELAWILKDVDIEIRIRSGVSELGILRELLKAVMASIVASGIPKEEIAEYEEKIFSTPKRSLRVVYMKLHIE